MFRLAYDLYSPDFQVETLPFEKFLEELEVYKRLKLVPKYLVGPLHVLWEITGKCNLMCKYCYNESPRTVTELTTEEALDLVDDLARLRVFSVCISGGEPLLRRDVFEIIEYLKSKHIGVAMVTNGTLIDEQNAKKLVELLDGVQLSLDAPYPELNDYLRGRGSFEAAIRAARLLNRHGIKDLKIAMLLTKLNAKPEIIYDMVKLCTKLNVKTLRMQPVIITGRACKHIRELMLEPHELEALKQYVNASKEFFLRNYSVKVELGDPSIHIRVGLVLGFVTFVRITAEGYYAISPYVGYTFGNVREISLSECWEKGLKVAWRHPVIKEKLSRIRSVLDMVFLGEEAHNYIKLSVEEIPVSDTT